MDFINIIKIYNNKNRTAILSLFFLLLLVISLYLLLKIYQNKQIESTILQTSIVLKENIEHEISNTTSLVAKIADKWQKDQGMSYNLWLLAAGQVVSLNPSLHAIQWVDKNYTVRWIQPLQGNIQGLNFNLANDEKIKQILDDARTNKETKASDIVQLRDGGTGILSISPIFQKDQFMGFMIGIFSIQKLLGAIINTEIFDQYMVTIINNNNSIYINSPKFTRNQLLSQLKKNQQINILNQKWQAEIIPSDFVVKNIKTWLPELVLLLGLVFAVLIALLAYYLNLYKRTSTQLQLLKNSVKSISENSEFDITLKECIEYLSIALGWDIGHAYLVNPDNNDQLAPSNIWYLSDKQKFSDIRRIFDKKSFAKKEGIPGKVLELEKPLWINNVTQDIIFPNSTDSSLSSIKSALGIPIKYMKKTAIVLAFYKNKKIDYDDEIVELINALSAELSIAYSKKQTEELWKRLALKDGVTHFMNYKTFFAKISEELFLAKRYNTKIAVITVNIDNFKQINDELGFEIGNKTLETIGAKVVNIVKNHGYIARYTGKKFGILLPKATDEDEIFSYVKKIHSALSRTMQVSEFCIRLKLKVGYKISSNSDDADKMVKYSDPTSPNNKVYS